LIFIIQNSNFNPIPDGFHKKVNVDGGGLKVDKDKDEMEFAHTYFVRKQPQFLDRIKRKIADTGRGATKSSPDVINKVLGDVKTVKNRQENLDSKLGAMKRENEALWRELAVLRQKHLKQQQIVNKVFYSSFQYKLEGL
jgi:heat shock transcription factor 1